jgi:hypothetical protein
MDRYIYGGLHTRNFHRSAALIGQFEFKYNFYGYRALFEHAIRQFQYNCTSLKVFTYYLLRTYAYTLRRPNMKF